jgi:hypothetical protein
MPTKQFPGASVADYGATEAPPRAISGGSGVNTQDETVAVDTPATTLNFAGTGVTATGGAGTTTVTVPGAGAAGGQFNWGLFIAGTQCWPAG